MDFLSMESRSVEQCLISLRHVVVPFPQFCARMQLINEAERETPRERFEVVSLILPLLLIHHVSCMNLSHIASVFSESDGYGRPYWRFPP